MNHYYTGIGSRSTPQPVLEEMTGLASFLAENGYTLRSGGATGADTAFEEGATQKEIYLPWQGFNGHRSNLCRVGKDALALAEQNHPAWWRCNRFSRLLLGRNCYQVLGADLATPTKFVVFWTKDLAGSTGGTALAVKLARSRNIPVFNLNGQVGKLQDDWTFTALL
jgi:hypothetical protein